MCNVNEEHDEAREFVQKEKCQISNTTICQKCNVEKALIVLRGKDVYCRDCFRAGATHKFRAALGKSKIVRPTDKILVAHSGKAGSTALLHLVKAGMHESVHKRLVFGTKVLYIDDGSAKEQSAEDRRKKILEINRQIASFGFETFASSLSQSLNNEESKIVTLEALSNCLCDFSHSDEILNDILAKLPDKTSKLELIRKLREKLIFDAARELGCNKIFLANDSTSLAVDILSNVSMGRGAQLSLDVGFLDDRFSDITLVRPMRDFTSHEITNYLDIHEVRIVDYDDLPSLADSIQGITEKFVTELDSRFNGTVSTIFRTGDKVCSVTRANRSSDEDCALCNAPLDTSASDTTISAIQATAFSRLASSVGPNGDLTGESNVIVDSSGESRSKINGCENCDNTCAKSTEMVLSMKNARRYLCYGCRLIFRNCETHDLPQYVLDAVREKITLENMRDEIEDFLL